MKNLLLMIFAAFMLCSCGNSNSQSLSSSSSDTVEETILSEDTLEEDVLEESAIEESVEEDSETIDAAVEQNAANDACDAVEHEYAYTADHVRIYPIYFMDDSDVADEVFWTEKLIYTYEVGYVYVRYCTHCYRSYGELCLNEELVEALGIEFPLNMMRWLEFDARYDRCGEPREYSIKKFEHLEALGVFPNGYALFYDFNLDGIDTLK